MRIASFKLARRTTYGVVQADRYVVPPAAFLKRYPNVISVLRGDAQRELEQAVKSDGTPVMPVATQPLPAVPNPHKIICVGSNYKSGSADARRAESAYPPLFIRFADSLAAHGDVVLRPPFSERLDWEGELAVVIGRGGRSISQADAFAHVAGYACFNDITVRDWQRHTHQWTPGKNFPGTGAFGPWLVTADEVSDVSALAVETRLNGEVMQRACVADLVFTIPMLIEYISRFTALAPGDVIATGSPACAVDRRSPPRYMKHGDLVEVQITGLGVLGNRIGTAAD